MKKSVVNVKDKVVKTRHKGKKGILSWDVDEKSKPREPVQENDGGNSKQ